MTLYDNYGQSVTVDWHPNGHLRTCATGSNGYCIQQQWERIVRRCWNNESVIETEWRKIPHEAHPE